MYHDFKSDIDARLTQAVKHDDPLEEAILTKVLYNLPDDQPTEALANLTTLAQQTNDPDVAARYIEELRTLAQLPEVQG